MCFLLANIKLKCVLFQVDFCGVLFENVFPWKSLLANFTLMWVLFEVDCCDVLFTSHQMSVKYAKIYFHGKAFSKSTPQKSTWKRTHLSLMFASQKSPMITFQQPVTTRERTTLERILLTLHLRGIYHKKSVSPSQCTFSAKQLAIAWRWLMGT